MTNRSFITIFLALLILGFPYWIYVPAVVMTILYFSYYYEAVFLGFLIDVFYGSSPHTGLSFHFPFALSFVLLVIMMLPLRQYLRIEHV